MSVTSLSRKARLNTGGVKQTELGALPSDWRVACLSECATRITDGEHATPKREASGYYLLSARNVLNGSVDLQDVDFVGEEEYRRIRRRCNPDPGDILISCSGTVGRVAVVPPGLNCVMVRSAALVKPNSARMSGTYAQYYLQSQPAQRQIDATLSQAAQPNLFLGTIEKIRVALPPTVAEQDEIAAALSDVDALIGALDKLIEKKRAIKLATMQQLLTGKTRLPGFSAAWKAQRVGEFTDCVAGGTPSTSVPGYWGGQIRWMSSGELHQKRVIEVEGRITELGLRNSAARMLPVGCVLVGLAGQGKTRGTVAINDVSLCTNQSIAAILPNDSFCSEYVYYNLDLRYDELRSMSTGDGGRGGLNLRIIRSITVPFPDTVEQKAIASVLSDMDAEIAALEQRRDKTKLIKQGMMQVLLTGKVRLV